MFADILSACRGTDAILYTVLGAAGYHVAEMLKIPSLYLLLQPFTRSREAPNFSAPVLPLGGTYNLATHLLSEQLLWQLARGQINLWRRESLDLEPIPFKGPFDLLYKQRMPYVYGFSHHVVPRQHDWPNWHHITGYWFLDEGQDWSPPEELVLFLTEGKKPISIGFGSMSGRVTRQLVQLTTEAVNLAGQRAVLLGGWAAAGDLDLPANFYALEAAPHAWLFPRMAAVVHHGGAGTTAAGLRAGVPAVVIPFFGDQPYWGQRVWAVGAGPKPIMRLRLTARRLADAILETINDRTMQTYAARLGEQIRREDGVSAAVAIINSYLCNQSSRGRRLTAPSHTTGHAGPHPAVHQVKRSS